MGSWFVVHRVICVQVGIMCTVPCVGVWLSQCSRPRADEFCPVSVLLVQVTRGGRRPQRIYRAAAVD